MAHCVIYIPGLGDDKNGDIQKRAIEKWRKFDLQPHYQEVNWNDSEKYKQKLNKIVKNIDDLLSQKNRVSLVSSSAGASLALNVYAQRKDKISSVVFISGKINRPEALGEKYKSKNPALLQSVRESSLVAAKLTKEDKQKMLTVFPLFDGVVGKADARIPGVKNKTTPVVFHALNIYLSLTLFRRISINFIKSKGVQ
jgi:predicted peptidase